MEDIKKLLIYFRNSVAFSYAWLVLCVAKLYKLSYKRY